MRVFFRVGRLLRRLTHRRQVHASCDGRIRIVSDIPRWTWRR